MKGTLKGFFALKLSDLINVIIESYLYCPLNTYMTLTISYSEIGSVVYRCASRMFSDLHFGLRPEEHTGGNETPTSVK